MSPSPTGVILVHGIGDQQPRETLDEFIAAADPVAASRPRTQLLRTLDPDAKLAYAGEQIAIHDKPVSVAEMYWSDLSSIATGPAATLVNFFKLAADAPEITYAALGPTSNGTAQRDYLVLRLARVLLCIGLWVIYWPILAVNLGFALLFGSMLVKSRIVEEQFSATRPADVELAVAAGVSLIAIAVAVRRGWLRDWTSQLVAAAVAVALIGGLAAANHVLTLRGPMTFTQYAELLILVLNCLWLVPVLVGAVIFSLIPLLCLGFRRRWRAILISFAVLFLVMRFWLILITTCWLVFFNTMLTPGEALVIKAEIRQGLDFISLLWFDLIVMGLVFASALVAHGLQTRRARRGRPPSSYVRLIVPGAALFVPLLLVASSFAMFGFCADLSPWRHREYCNLLDAGNELIIARAGLLLLLGALVVHRLHGGFKVANDIVNYFRSDAPHRHANPLRAISLAFRHSPNAPHSFRAQLRKRLLALIDDVTAREPSLGKLVIVAHSLGTMVALDALREPRRPGPPVHLVLMGSPYTTVFQHYFPHMFAPIGPHDPAGAASITNIYRANEYVGAWLDDPERTARQIAQGADGHFGYFSDRRVLAEYRHLI